MKKIGVTVIVAPLFLVTLFPIFTVQSVKAQANASGLMLLTQVMNESGIWLRHRVFLASEAGDLVVLSEVQNVGAGVIQNATLSAMALSANGTVLGTATTQEGMGTVFTYQTLPGAKAPFVIDFPESGSWSSQVTNVSVTSCRSFMRHQRRIKRKI